MSWKRILVHVKPYRNDVAHLELAARIAHDCGGELTAIYTLRELALLKTLLGPTSRASRDAELRDAGPEAMARARFEEIASAHTVPARWEVAEGGAADVLPLAARYHDLVVVEQSRPLTEELTLDRTEYCAIAGGTPTLVVPHAGTFTSAGQRVLVAWNASRQSASALAGAHPLVTRAMEVVVLVGGIDPPPVSVTRLPDFDIAARIKAHNSNVVVRPCEVAGDAAGAAILAAVRDTGSDMLVMGAFGRSAWREYVFGGATSYVLANMTVPVLLGH